MRKIQTEILSGLDRSISLASLYTSLSDYPLHFKSCSDGISYSEQCYYYFCLEETDLCVSLVKRGHGTSGSEDQGFPFQVSTPAGGI